MPFAGPAIVMDYSGSSFFVHQDIINPPAVHWTPPVKGDPQWNITSVVDVTQPITRYLNREEQETFEIILRESGRIRQIIKL